MSSGVNFKCQNANLYNLQLGLIYKHILHTNHLIFNFNTHCQVFKQGYKNGQNINANFFTKLLLNFIFTRCNNNFIIVDISLCTGTSYSLLLTARVYTAVNNRWSI